MNITAKQVRAWQQPGLILHNDDELKAHLEFNPEDTRGIIIGIAFALEKLAQLAEQEDAK